MAEVYDLEGTGDETEYWFREGNYEARLNEDNLMGNFHRKAPLYDCIAIHDATDGAWWTWWRYDQPEEVFEQLEFVTNAVGTFVVRDTVMADMEERFDNRHQFTETDWQELEGGDAS